MSINGNLQGLLGDNRGEREWGYGFPFHNNHKNDTLRRPVFFGGAR